MAQQGAARNGMLLMSAYGRQWAMKSTAGMSGGGWNSSSTPTGQAWIGDNGLYAAIASTDTQGGVLWSRELGDGALTLMSPRFVTADSSGNIFVFGDVLSGTYYYAFLAKYNSAGTIQWQRKFTATLTNVYGREAALASSGNIYITGTVDGSGQWVAKLNSSGVIQWQRYITHAAGCSGRSIAVDSSENVYVAGQWNNAGTEANPQAGYVVKYNTSGTLQWQRVQVGVSISGSTWTTPSYDKIRVDSSDNIYLIGLTRIFADPDIGAVMLKADSSGAVTWSVKFMGLGLGSGNQHLAVTSDRAIGGMTYVASDSPYYEAIFLAGCDTDDGTVDWQRSLNTAAAETDCGLNQVSWATQKGDPSYFVIDGGFDGWADSKLFRIAVDGDGTGTWDGVTYEASAFTASSGNQSWTAGSLTVTGPGSVTDAAGTLTDQAGSFTASLTGIF